MAWTPPPRPRWLERLNTLGPAAGSAADLIPLDGAELIDRACGSTELDDFGGDSWRPHFDLLVNALQNEAQLHTAGRLIARSELLRSLRNRLLITEFLHHGEPLVHPGIEAPVFVVGTARSGTSILHELLGCDPDNRLPTTWEVLHPVEAARGQTEMAAIGDGEVTLWHDLQPEYQAMHLNGGELPTECIFLTMNEFLSDQWGGCHRIPSYSAHLAAIDHTDAYRFHRRQLQVMQQREHRSRWVLKAPSHLATLPALFSVYPDARVIFIHRDPLQTVPSTLSLMATLKWMRSDVVDLEDAVAVLPVGFAWMLDAIITMRADGVIPDDQIVDLRYRDLLADPAGAVAAAYRHFGLRFSPEVGRTIEDYVARKPRGKHGTHRYSLDDLGLDHATERERFAFYTDRFDLVEDADRSHR
ncbi:MAG: sulfotransferase [Acidimicrobiia bacterium]|nr:sulfotransferase [Acidimicrobiia bacterium]